MKRITISMLLEEELVLGFDFRKRSQIKQGALLTGVPTVTAQRLRGTGELAISDAQVAEGVYVLFKVVPSGGDGTDSFLIKCSAGLDDAAGQVIAERGRLDISDE